LSPYSDTCFFIRVIVSVLIGAGAIAPAYGQSVPIDYEAIRATRILTAVRIHEGIIVDGHLDEPVWQEAPVATDFIQKFPNNGAPSTERTVVRVLYDEDNLYVGFWCFDSTPSKLLIKDLREDFDINTTDLAQVFIDSLHDKRSGFSFSVNPGGARRDTQVSNGATLNGDWDAVWDAKVSRDAEGWYVEYSIPFKTLRFSKDANQEWGLNLTRRILHRNEDSQWVPVPVRYSSARPDQAGTLRGLQGIRQGRNLKIKPFAISGLTESRASGPLRTSKEYDGGFDVKYSLTPALTLDTTVRTDFAQVEVDQQQVNLTRFNLFFPEKRDFFLENSGTFGFGSGGRGLTGGNLVPFFSRRIGLSAAGTPIPILGGARISGQVNRYDVGVLAMKTERLGATPSNNYLVGRIKRNLMNTSWVGAIVTDRESALTNEYNRVYGPDVHLQLRDKIEIDSYVLRSDTPGRPGRNQARQLKTAWTDDELTAAAEYSAVEANFNPEVGFVRRGNNSLYSGDISWRPQLDRSETIRYFAFGTSVDYYKGGTGKLETRAQEGTLGIHFENTGSVTFKVTDTFDRLERPFGIRPSMLLPAGEYQYRRYSASVNTGARRKVAFDANAGWGEFWNGTNESLSAGLEMRPSYHLNVDLSYSRNHVMLPTGEFTTQLVGARILYGFTPRAFVNAFLQYNADTHQVSSNLRFNFTHHPLSDIYVVYNDRRDTVGGQLIERAFIVKVTNLFNF
jgi:hypothetical protein